MDFKVKTRSPRGGLLFFAAIFVLGTAGAIFQMLWVRSKMPELQAARSTAIEQAPAVFMNLGLPLGSAAYDSQTRSDRTPRKGKWRGEVIEIEWRQTFTAPGNFASTRAWYRAQLAAKGWKVFDPDNRSEIVEDFCSPPWMLRLEQDAFFDSATQPAHRFRLRLQWIWQFHAGRCPYPGPFR